MTTAIIGRTGSGKTVVAKQMATVALANNRRVAIVDPTGAWWGLRLTADGRGASPYTNLIIFGGDHADVPIDPRNGEDVANMMVGRGPVVVSQAIVDVSEMSGGEQALFLTMFFETLYKLNRAPLELFLDEADAMAPQNPLPETKRMLGAVDKIVRRGRIKGFRPTLITQRPAVLHKNVLSQASTLIAMRLTGAHDREAVKDWIKGSADLKTGQQVLDSLPSLNIGEGWEWSPAQDVLIRRQFPMISTYDSSRAPDDDSMQPTLAPLQRPDVDELRRIFEPVPEPPKPKKGETVVYASEAEIQAAYDRGRKAGFDNSLLIGKRAALDGILGDFDSFLAMWKRNRDGVEKDFEAFIDATPKFATPAPAAPVRAAPPAPRRPVASGELNSAGKKMLAVLDTNPPVKRSWTQIATLAGLRARGGHFNAGKKALIDSGSIAVEGDLVRIANPSRSAAAAMTDPAALVEMWAGNLSGAAPKILRDLFTRAQNGRGAVYVSKNSIALDLDMQPRGGHWNAAWKELRDNEIIEAGSANTVRLTALFRGEA